MEPVAPGSAGRVSEREVAGFNVALREPNLTRSRLQTAKLKLPKWDERLGYWTYGEDIEDVRAVGYLERRESLMFYPSATARLRRLQTAFGSQLGTHQIAETLQTLRPYQREGIAFARKHGRILLADSMGLGKTVQALMTIEQEDAYPSLIICPASVKATWANEITKWLPHRRFQTVYGKDSGYSRMDFTIVNPEILRENRVSEMEKWPRHSIVLDEAHFFKDPGAARSKNAARLARDVPFRLALTGTPIKNTRQDLVMQLKILGQLEPLMEKVRPLLKTRFGIDPFGRTSGTRPELGWETATAFLNLVPPKELHEALTKTCMIRRTKEDVGDSLPPFVRTRLEEDIEQLENYARREHDLVQWVQAYSDRGVEGPLQGQEFTQFRQHVSALRQEAALAKVAVVAEWAEGLHESGERVVIFAYHKEVAHRLAAKLPGRTAVITGDVMQEERTRIISRLNNYDFLVATMDSAGQGVDGMQLHASHVAFIELDWTPTKHEQCEGRLHRIGQRRDHVNAWYFIAQGTIDVDMIRRLDAKWNDIRGVVDGLAGEGEGQFLGSIVQRVIEQQAWSKEGRIQWASEATA